MSEFTIQQLADCDHMGCDNCGTHRVVFKCMEPFADVSYEFTFCPEHVNAIRDMARRNEATDYVTDILKRITAMRKSKGLS